MHASVDIAITMYLLCPYNMAGLPLSLFCHMKITAYFLVFIINPIVCFLAAINKANKEDTSTFSAYVSHMCTFYKQHLLMPDDWFSFWQLNCRLASYHSGKQN